MIADSRLLIPKPLEKKWPVRVCRQATPSPAQQRPGARSARPQRSLVHSIADLPSFRGANHAVSRSVSLAELGLPRCGSGPPPPIPEEAVPAAVALPKSDAVPGQWEVEPRVWAGGCLTDLSGY